MTIDDLLKVPPRERDAMVSEKVMGWRWVTPAYECDPSLRHRWLLPPTDAKAEWNKAATPDLPIDFRSLAALTPEYSADPAADYEVLRHVRQRWGHTFQIRFQNQLYELQRGRTFDGEKDWRHFSSRTGPGWLYEPGDYALAALAVVTANAEVPTP